MRGLLWGLLLANFFYACLIILRDGESAGSAGISEESVVAPSVFLTTEIAPDLLHLYSMDNSPRPTSALIDIEELSVNNGAENYCAQIGPFISLADADEFIESYSERMKVMLEVRQIPAAPQYRVYLPPLANREAAVSAIEQLRAAFVANNLVIDSFLIPRGELTNGIALGLFSEQANASSVQVQLQSLGYNVTVQAIQGSKEVVETTVSVLGSEEVFRSFWAEIILTRPYLLAVEKLCETIAQGI